MVSNGILWTWYRAKDAGVQASIVSMLAYDVACASELHALLTCGKVARGDSALRQSNRNLSPNDTTASNCHKRSLVKLIAGHLTDVCIPWEGDQVELNYL